MIKNLTSTCSALGDWTTEQVTTLQPGGTVCRHHADNTTTIRGGEGAGSGWTIGKSELVYNPGVQTSYGSVTSRALMGMKAFLEATKGA